MIIIVKRALVEPNTMQNLYMRGKQDSIQREEPISLDEPYDNCMIAKV
jgi:hypothetical protein